VLLKVFVSNVSVNKMPKLSILSHFYNSHEWVDKQIKHWQAIDANLRHLFEIILVDDHSDAYYELPETDLNIRLFRVLDDIDWNQAGARNLATYHATGEVAMFIDIDQLIYVNFLERLAQVTATIERDTMHFFKIKDLTNILNNEKLVHHPNAFFVNLQDFKTLGGYDEDFCGHYGYEDIYLQKMWENRGGRFRLIDEVVSEDLPFGTWTLDRDLQRNYQLALEKINTRQYEKPKNLLRFRWECIDGG
jgi:glycosyltransferase involved in cell wall biosynthesis